MHWGVSSLPAGPADVARLLELRDVVVSVRHRAGFRQIAARLRHNSRHPKDVLPLLGLALNLNA